MLEATLQCTKADGYIYTLQEHERQKARFDAMMANYERQLEEQAKTFESKLAALSPLSQQALVSTQPVSMVAQSQPTPVYTRPQPAGAGTGPATGCHCGRTDGQEDQDSYRSGKTSGFWWGFAH